MNLIDIGKKIAEYGAPLLGGAIAGPAGAAIGQIVATQFGADVNDAPDLLKKITEDPNAKIKLIEIQSNCAIELQKITLQMAQNELAKEQTYTGDAQDARKSNQNPRTIDNTIKIILVASVIAIIFYCLYGIIKGDINQNEGQIIYMVLGSVLTALTAMVFSYWGRTGAINLPGKN